MRYTQASSAPVAEPIDDGTIRLRSRDDYIVRTHAFEGAAQPANQPTPLTALLVTWRRRYVTRRHLRALDRHGLADIGIEPAEREREIAKPFWRP